jgi:hypothetical protein
VELLPAREHHVAYDAGAPPRKQQALGRCRSSDVIELPVGNLFDALANLHELRRTRLGMRQELAAPTG